jgi:hypothetical protein
MPLTSQQIVTQACAIARANGFLALAGQQMNNILQELCLTYDLVINRKTATITLSTGSGLGIVGQGSGPYLLPLDYLRLDGNEIVYRVYGVPYKMIRISLEEFDSLVQQAGISNYPEQYATDLSQDAITTWGAPVLYVWPPSGGVYQPQIRYWSLRPDVATPETSPVPPWFTSNNYLITRIAGELMKITGDERASKFLGDGPDGAQGILQRLLKLQHDDEGMAKAVQLDRRHFGKSFSRLPQTKTLGW